MERDVNRRSFFRALGLGAAAAASSTVVAKAAAANPNPVMYPGRHLGDGQFEAVTSPMGMHTDPFGSHNHIPRTCGCGPHNHCMCAPTTGGLARVPHRA